MPHARRQRHRCLNGGARRPADPERITIARAGLPIAVLSRYEPEVRPPRVPGSAKGLFTVPDDFNDPMPAFHGWEPHPLDPLRDL